MANNITVLDSTGTSKNWATSEGSDSQHRQHVVPTDANGTAVIGTTTSAAVTTDTTGTVIGFLRGLVSWFARLGGVDGSAFTSGSSYVWAGLGGVYQSTVGTLTAGQRGLARLTARRAVVVAGDSEYTASVITWAASSADKDAQISWPVWANRAVIALQNATDQSVTMTVSVMTGSGTGMTSASIVSKLSGALAISVASGAFRMIAPGAASGTPAEYTQIDALANNYAPCALYFFVRPAGTATGDLRYCVTFSAK